MSIFFFVVCTFTTTLFKSFYNHKCRNPELVKCIHLTMEFGISSFKRLKVLNHFQIMGGRMTCHDIQEMKLNFIWAQRINFQEESRRTMWHLFQLQQLRNIGFKSLYNILSIIKSNQVWYGWSLYTWYIWLQGRFCNLHTLRSNRLTQL